MITLSPGASLEFWSLSQHKGTIFVSDRRAASIIQDVADDTGVSVEAILSPSRQADVAAARRVVFSRLRTAGASLHRIAEITNRDHSTVFYGVRKALGK